MKILIVDDEPYNLMGLNIMIECAVKALFSKLY